MMMSTKKDQPQIIGKKTHQAAELKTEGPLSEKDEVKDAERRMAKRLKKPATVKKDGK
jgi:hypothetical protein